MKPSILEEVAVTCAEWPINVRLESIIVFHSSNHGNIKIEEFVLEVHRVLTTSQFYRVLC